MKCQPGTTKAMSSEFFLAVHEYKQQEMPGPEAARTPITRMAGSAGSATPCSTPPVTWASQPSQGGGWKGCCECALILAVSWGSTCSVSWKDWVPGTGSLSPRQQSGEGGHGKHGGPSLACVTVDFHPQPCREGHAVAQMPFCSSPATSEGQAEVVMYHLLPSKRPQDFRTAWKTADQAALLP